MADNADGHLDMVVAGPVSRIRILRLLPKLMRGEHMGETEVTHASIRQLKIEASEPIPSHLDGEVQELQSSFEIELLPGALRLL
jgi:diacylglycerol kinase (ATP)